MKTGDKTKPTQANKKAGAIAAASFMKKAKQEEVKVENEKGSPLKKGAERINERSRSSDGQNAGAKQKSRT